MRRRLSRRQALGGLMSAGAGLSVASVRADAPADAAAAAPLAVGDQPPGVCILLPQAVEGPFYLDPKLVRADISEGRPGLPLSLALRIIEAGPCTPIAGARVDVWHADARGIYSGYSGQGDDRRASTVGETYLRGTQITTADGSVTFRSIFPGWYPGRTPHIHVKVFVDAKTVLTGQIYFTDALSARIYDSREPYARRPHPDTTNATDFIFKAGEREGGGTVLTVREEPDLLVATLVIAVDRSGAAAGGRAGWGGTLRRLLGGG